MKRAAVRALLAWLSRFVADVRAAFRPAPDPEPMERMLEQLRAATRTTPPASAEAIPGTPDYEANLDQLVDGEITYDEFMRRVRGEAR